MALNKYQQEIRDLTIKRNRLVMDLNESGWYSVKIPLISVEAAVESSRTKHEYYGQKKALKAFIEGDMIPVEVGSHTVPQALLDETELRANYVNKEVLREQKSGIRLQKKGITNLGKIEPAIKEIPDRIVERLVPIKAPNDYKSKKGYEDYLNRVINASTKVESMEAWKGFQANEVKAMRRSLNEARGRIDDNTKSKIEDLITKVENLPLSKIRSAYYRDVAGTIEYFAIYGEDAERVIRRFVDIANIYGIPFDPYDVEFEEEYYDESELFS